MVIDIAGGQAVHAGSCINSRCFLSQGVTKGPMRDEAIFSAQQKFTNKHVSDNYNLNYKRDLLISEKTHLLS